MTGPWVVVILRWLLRIPLDTKCNEPDHMDGFMVALIAIVNRMEGS